MAELNDSLDEKKAKTISKYPLAVLVFIVSSLLTTAVNRLFTTEDNRNDDCQEQVIYLREELKLSNATLNDYVKTILFKDAQIKNRDLALDSLKKEREAVQ